MLWVARALAQVVRLGWLGRALASGAGLGWAGGSAHSSRRRGRRKSCRDVRVPREVGGQGGAGPRGGSNADWYTLSIHT